MIFDLLTDEEKKLCKRVHLAKGEILFREDDISKEIGIVIHGLISISSYSYQGIEMNYNNILPGGIFANNLIFSSEPYHRGNVIAKLESDIVLIEKANLIKILMNNEPFLKEYLKIQSDFGKTLNNKIKTLSFVHAEDRLLFYLSSHNNEIKFRSVTELANTLNLSREALSRLISRLIKENKIIKTKYKLILNQQ